MMNNRRRRRLGEDSSSSVATENPNERSFDAPDKRKGIFASRARRRMTLVALLFVTCACLVIVVKKQPSVNQTVENGKQVPPGKVRKQPSSVIQSANHVHVTQAPQQRVGKQTAPDNTKEEVVLRRDWTKFTKLSTLAQGYKRVQSNCQVDSTMKYKFPVAGVGLGSELHGWTQRLCEEYSNNRKITSAVYKGPWTWLDQESCNEAQAKKISPLYCYFPSADGPCTNTEPLQEQNSWGSCNKLKEDLNLTTSDIRTAGIEFLFSNVSPLVIQEAKRQARLVFGNKPIPKNLVTVHVRWGDKVTSREMQFVPIEKYIDAVSKLVQQRNLKEKVSVYLATEDPKAVQQFQEKAPPEWDIYIDQYFHEVKQYRQVDKELWNQNVVTSKQMKGKAGLLTLASLLVAMEANDYVLTTASNWSRLMNELRTAIIDVECGECTRMIDVEGPSESLQYTL